MTEEQRKDAMMALGRIVLSIEGLKMDYKQDVQTIIYALQYPPVPVIEGLDEATSYIVGLARTSQRNIQLCHLTQADHEYKKADMLLKCVKACEEYSKLQKGE